MTRNNPEILAPVGGAEQLTAALRCGADAVYFGLQNFNARRNASNFNGDDLAETIRKCHIHSCRVYITVNTIVFDDELVDAYKTVDQAVNAGADALIVQDLAIAEYAKEHYPKLKLIASTQMAVHNSEGVKALQKMGFDRIVLARELSFDEIKKNNSGDRSRYGSICSRGALYVFVRKLLFVFNDRRTVRKQGLLCSAMQTGLQCKWQGICVIS